MNQRLSRPGGSGAGSELWFKAAPRAGRHERRHALRIALELVEEDRHQVGIELCAAQAAQLVGARGHGAAHGWYGRPWTIAS